MSRTPILHPPSPSAMLLSALATLTLAAPAATNPVQEGFAIRADTLVLGDGTRVEDGVLVIRGDKIVAAGQVDVPEGMSVHHHPGFVSPGLVAADSRLVPSDETIDTTRPFLEDARIVDGFDAHHPALRAALEQGITSAVVSPTPNTPVGGRTAVVKTTGTVLQEDAHLAVAMQSSAIRGRTAPTGYSGLVQGLRDRLEAGEGVWGELGAAQKLAFIRVDDRHDVTRAIDLGQASGLRGVLVGASLAGEIVDLLSGAGFALVWPAYGPADATGRTREASVALSASELLFGYTLGSPLEFRFPAAAALRDGGEASSIERGFFSSAATLGLVSDRVGRLAPGLDADFVLWSGDPLALTSRVEAVYVDGTRAYRRSEDTSASRR